MSRFGTDYHVARATGMCSETHQRLLPGATCMATLCERAEDDGFERCDFSLAAWEAGARPVGLYSYWKTMVPEPDARPRLLVDDAVLMDLFERLGHDDRPQRIAFRFVLCLILMRKKLLKFVGRATADDVETWMMQPRRPAESQIEPPLIEVINPNLNEDDVRELIDQLSEVLQSEL